MDTIVYIMKGEGPWMDLNLDVENGESDSKLFEAMRYGDTGSFDRLKEIVYKIKFDLLKKDGSPLKRIRKVADFNCLCYSNFMITKNVLDVLPIKGNAFIKPVINNNKDFCNQEFFHIFPSVFLKDAIDMDKSMIKFWEGKPESVLKLVLKEGVITPPFFRIKEFPLDEIYFNQEFVDTYRKSNLTGVTFQDARQLRYFGTSSDVTNIPFLEGELSV